MDGCGTIYVDGVLIVQIIMIMIMMTMIMTIMEMMTKMTVIGVGQAAKRHVALDVEFAPSFVDNKVIVIQTQIQIQMQKMLAKSKTQIFRTTKWSGRLGTMR